MSPRSILHPLALAALMLLCGSMVSSAAWAQSCSVSATAVSFGSYNRSSATPNDANGTVTVTCAPAVVALLLGYTVTLSSGTGTYANRRMTAGSRNASYQLYKDVLRTSVLGDGSAGTSTIQGGILLALLSSVTISHPIYGRMPAQQNLAPGSYSDVIVVTVAY